MQINERFIKFSSRVPFPTDIPLGTDVIVTVGSQIYTYNAVKIETLDNQDGSVNTVTVLKALVE